jgi:phage tail-like protein
MSIPSLSMPGLGLGSGLPSYGMAMRFTVSVDGLSLGHWSGCKNLKMDFKVTRLREGGNYGSDLILPDQVVGAAVTLERAMEKTDSAKVQSWLATVAADWASNPKTEVRAYQTSTAVITLFDVTGVQTASWTLGGVFPSSWSGPGLSASENKVALETLVLEYQTITTGSGSVAPSVSQASLSQGGTTVNFPFSPEKISVSHSAKLEEITTGTENTASTGEMPYEDRLKAIGPTIIGLSGVMFDGGGVLANCNQLLVWTNAEALEGSKVPKLPLLTFQWGTTVWKVKLMSADITYTRFSTNGVPIRAQANLKFISQDDPLKPTNPSSGGLPGRRSHVVIAGENLQHVAMASYGRPGAWRAVAAANGIEDPLRVRPGAVIYLPGPEELATGSTT